MNMPSFEEAIRHLTRPLNGQYPRPWMTKLSDPTAARVFIVGKNQAKGYPVEQVGSQERFLDALFNRKGLSCRGLYDEITGGAPSPTRRNIDDLTIRLEKAGVPEVLETNVICYSTPLSADLKLPVHQGGKERGHEIFRTLLHFIAPQLLIVHGADATRKLAKVVGTPLPVPPEVDQDPVQWRTEKGLVVVLPSLAPPKYNTWSRWAPSYLGRVVEVVAREVANPNGNAVDLARFRGIFDRVG